MAKGRVVLAAALAAAALVAWRLIGSTPGPGGPGDTGGPAELPLLWIEEINSRLLPPGGKAAVAPPGDDPAVGTDAGTGASPAVDEDRRVLGLSGVGLSSRGAERALVIRYGVYDHDLLVHETFTAATSFPLEVVPPPAGGEAAARLLPRSILITGVDPAGAVTLEVDGRSLRLEEGQAWATARVAEGGRIVEVNAAAWSRDLAAALDEDRPVTVLRLLHRGRWLVEAVGGDGR